MLMKAFVGRRSGGTNPMSSKSPSKFTGGGAAALAGLVKQMEVLEEGLFVFENRTLDRPDGPRKIRGTPPGASGDTGSMTTETKTDSVRPSVFAGEVIFSSPRQGVGRVTRAPVPPKTEVSIVAEETDCESALRRTTVDRPGRAVAN